jgi:hypothetical protein
VGDGGEEIGRKWQSKAGKANVPGQAKQEELLLFFRWGLAM